MTWAFLGKSKAFHEPMQMFYIHNKLHVWWSDLFLKYDVDHGIMAAF